MILYILGKQINMDIKIILIYKNHNSGDQNSNNNNNNGVCFTLHYFLKVAFCLHTSVLVSILYLISKKS